METTAGVRELVLAFLEALNHEDFQTARDLVSDDFSFVGVLGSRDGAEAYFGDMRRMRIKYTIRKVFVEGQDVCVFYDLTLSDKTIFACGWYQAVNGKIHSLRVVFDPRPLVETKTA
jgi:ketosteroid isomerase-like protein